MTSASLCLAHDVSGTCAILEWMKDNSSDHVADACGTVCVVVSLEDD